MDEKLKAALDAGRLVRPKLDEPNSVDLARALAHLAGVEGFSRTAGLDKIEELIGPADHLVFVLVDALGMNILQRMPAESFLRAHTAMTLTAICPSTTAAGLTTFGTAAWPAQHAVTGWWTHLPEFGLTSTILPFVDRYTEKSLTERGLGAADVFPTPSIFPRMKHEPLTLLPQALVDSIYSTYARGGTLGRGYRAIVDAIDHIIARIAEAGRPTYTYLYIAEVDALGHRRGFAHDDMAALVAWMDHQLSRLADGLRGRARLVISADHGQVNIPVADRLVLRDRDPMLELLSVPPSGGAPMPLFHLRPGKHAEFERMFRDRFGQWFALLSTDEAETMELFGPRPLSDTARRRFGDYSGIALRPATLRYYLPGELPPLDHFGSHCGLIADEMYVPLAVA